VNSGQTIGLVAFSTDINIALFNYLTKKVYNESGNLNYPFWTSMYQQDQVIEPDEGFYFNSPDWVWEDRLGTKVWRNGQPDNRDDDTADVNVNCACYDARNPDGLFDCSCASLRIPVCTMLGNDLNFYIPIFDIFKSKFTR
jgi:hypothetical protein